MSTKKKKQPSTTAIDQRRTAILTWAAFLAVPAALAVLVILTLASEQEGASLGAAPDFTLTNTAGEDVSLDETLDDGDTLLYFSMGVGCDGCFAQIPELDAALAERDLQMLSIVVDPPELVLREEERFGIHEPILIDAGSQVSSQYGMIGVYGHNDRPSHSFALVNQEGNVEWVRHYAEMFVPAEALMAEMEEATGR